MSTILIVEDNIPFRESLKEMLLAHFPSVTIEEASDAIEAMKVVSATCPDLMFVDIRLPGESGLELTRKVKQDYTEIAVIVITNYDMTEYREAARRYGAAHFVHKGSATRGEIISIVETHLRDSGGVTDGHKTVVCEE